MLGRGRVPLCVVEIIGALCAYDLRVATPIALVHASIKTRGDARSWYMISEDAKSCVCHAALVVRALDYCWLLSVCYDALAVFHDALRALVVPIPLPDDPYVAVRQAYLVDTGSESEPEEAPSEAEEFQSLASSDSTTLLSPEPPVLPLWKRYCGMSDLIADTESESSGSDSEEEENSSDSDDEGPGAEDEGHGSKRKEEAVSEGQQQATPVVDTTVGEPLGLGYGALRRRESAVGEGEVPNTFEMDPEDGRVYTDIPAYVPQVAHVQTPPYPEWSFGSMLVSPSSLAVLTPVASPTTSSPVASPVTVEAESFMAELGAQRYERDFGELYTRLGAVRGEIFSQRYRLRSLEREHERTTVTFDAIWRPVLALESWAGRTDAHRAAPWQAIYDSQGENYVLRRQFVEERHEQLDLIERITRIERRQESRGG
ncbi:hypothetical protein Tco_0756237 [Tanacetum coccineum]